MSVLKDDTLSTACELTMLTLSISVTFSVACLTVASLITKSYQQRLRIHSCSFYKVVHLQIWGLVANFRIYTWTQLISVCNSEIIIKIGQYLPTICSNEKGSSFLTHSVFTCLLGSSSSRKLFDKNVTKNML